MFLLNAPLFPGPPCPLPRWVQTAMLSRLLLNVFLLDSLIHSMSSLSFNLAAVHVTLQLHPVATRPVVRDQHKHERAAQVNIAPAGPVSLTVPDKPDRTTAPVRFGRGMAWE